MRHLSVFIHRFLRLSTRFMHSFLRSRDSGLSFHVPVSLWRDNRPLLLLGCSIFSSSPRAVSGPCRFRRPVPGAPSSLPRPTGCGPELDRRGARTALTSACSSLHRWGGLRILWRFPSGCRCTSSCSAPVAMPGLRLPAASPPPVLGSCTQPNVSGSHLSDLVIQLIKCRSKYD